MYCTYKLVATLPRPAVRFGSETPPYGSAKKLGRTLLWHFSGDCLTSGLGAQSDDFAPQKARLVRNRIFTHTSAKQHLADELR